MNAPKNSLLTALTLLACACASEGPEAVERSLHSALPLPHVSPRVFTKTADIRLSEATGESHLVDAQDHALYVSTDDSRAFPQEQSVLTAPCVRNCVAKWVPFDVRDLSVGEGLAPHDFSRVARPDGRFQTTYRGRPLYRFVLDGDTAEVTGDGLDGRWFVARKATDLLAFVPNR